MFLKCVGNWYLQQFSSHFELVDWLSCLPKHLPKPVVFYRRSLLQCHCVMK